MSPKQKVEYLLSLREQGVSVMAILKQYGVSRSTFYYWISRYETHHTYENLSFAPHRTKRKVTEEIKAQVFIMHKANPRLGCWRLSLFDYGNQKLSHTTIWRILIETKPKKSPPQSLYTFTHYHQTWFIDHMHLRTLPDGKKVYSLIVLDGMSRVLLEDEICLKRLV